MQQEIFHMKAKTRDGKAFRDEEVAAKKTIARLEKKVQLSRIQLSVAHSENCDMRRDIDAMRLNKTMYLQIRNDMVITTEIKFKPSHVTVFIIVSLNNITPLLYPHSGHRAGRDQKKNHCDSKGECHVKQQKVEG